MWILFVFMQYTVTTAEFTTKNHCEQARTSLSTMTDAKTLCVYSGE